MSVEHTDVAAYALGLLEPGDRLDFEAHLASCETCAAEHAEFAAMAGLFEGVGRLEPGADEPDESAIVDLVSRRALALRRRKRQRAMLTAAACVVLLAIGVVTGVATAPRSTTSATLILTGARHAATNPATGITGTVGLVAKPWGTQVTLQLGKVRGPLDCELIAVSKTGQQRVVAGWRVPASGYGVSGHPADLVLEGGTSFNPGNLAAIRVVVVHGRTLLSIPI